MSDNIEVIHDKGEVIILKDGKILYEGKNRRMAKNGNGLTKYITLAIFIVTAAVGYGALGFQVQSSAKTNDKQDTEISTLKQSTGEISTNQDWMMKELDKHTKGMEEQTAIMNRLADKFLNDR